MDAIKRISSVKNNMIILNGLDMFNNKTVEVIILPLSDEKKKSVPDKKELLKFRGAGESGFSAVDLQTRGISQAKAGELRSALMMFAEDWDSPEMSMYDNYDTFKSRI